MARVIFSDKAIRHLEEISEYFAVYAPRYEKQMIRAIIAKARRLGIFPESGEVVWEIGGGHLRQIVAGNYRVLYQIEENGTLVRIAAVFHAARILTEEMFDG